MKNSKLNSFKASEKALLSEQQAKHVFGGQDEEKTYTTTYAATNGGADTQAQKVPDGGGEMTCFDYETL